MKSLTISILVAIILIGGSLLLTKNSSSPTQDSPDNVSIVDGKQIIEINAKGGYSPRINTAKADIPSVIRMKTVGTFDCSSALVIPSLNYQTNLQPSGITEIDIPPQKSGTTLQGLCKMGMFNFAIKFE